MHNTSPNLGNRPGFNIVKLYIIRLIHRNECYNRYIKLKCIEIFQLPEKTTLKSLDIFYSDRLSYIVTSKSMSKCAKTRSIAPIA